MLVVDVSSFSASSAAVNASPDARMEMSFTICAIFGSGLSVMCIIGFDNNRVLWKKSYMSFSHSIGIFCR